MSLGLLVLLALATGVLTPVQSAANAKFSRFLLIGSES
jgi:hypothetical protein